MEKVIRNKILIIGFVWPEPKSSAAGGRMMQLIHFFKSQDCEVTFVSPCAKTERAFPLETIHVKPVLIELNNTSFDEFIKDLKPDIVLFDRFMIEEQFGWRVTEQCPDALKILDTEDLHCLRKGRHAALKKGKPFDKTFLFNDFAKREIASIYRCDLSLIISETEMELLTTDFKIPINLLVYLPFMLEAISDQNIKQLPKFNQRNHFISIGNFLHEPNYNAVLYLKETIWPLIRKQLPDAELHIYGAYAAQKVTQLNNKKDGFIVKGFAEDVNLVMQQAKVCLAPIRFGAGLKGKLVDAMYNGTPSVTTAIGAEGMFGENEPNGFVENNPEKFAQKAVELFQSKNTWEAKQQNGFYVYNARFNRMTFEEKLYDSIKETILNLTTQRLHNFTGQMLQYHMMQSTKFMSKWIEAKNLKN